MRAAAAGRSLAETLETVRELTAVLQDAAEDIAREHRQAFDFFEFAPQACVITGADGRVLAANLAAEELLGLPRARMAGRYLSAFLGLRAGVRARAMELPGGQRSWRLERG